MESNSKAEITLPLPNFRVIGQEMKDLSSILKAKLTVFGKLVLKLKHGF